MVKTLDTIISELNREQCLHLLCSLMSEDEINSSSDADLRTAISDFSKNGTLAPIDIRMEATTSGEFLRLFS